MAGYPDRPSGNVVRPADSDEQGSNLFAVAGAVLQSRQAPFKGPFWYFTCSRTQSYIASTLSHAFSLSVPISLAKSRIFGSRLSIFGLGLR